VRRRKPTRSDELRVLRDVSDQDLVAMIRRKLALPMRKRMGFLRVKYPWGGSSL
jgi:hypothetical protein